MTMKPTTIAEHIASAPKAGQAHLNKTAKILREVAPDAAEAIKWGYPVLEHRRILFAFAGFKNHMNFMPTASSIEPFADELKDYKIGNGGGTVQFPYDKPLPEELIKKIAKHRLKDVLENDAHWS